MCEPVSGQKAQSLLPELGDGWVPLEALTIVKCLNPRGEIRYREMLSRNLHPVEALGMLTTMADTMRQRLMAGARPADQDE